MSLDESKKSPVRPEQGRYAPPGRRNRGKHGGDAASNGASDGAVAGAGGGAPAAGTAAGRTSVNGGANLPDFFTDSLNTSYIPSPSPARRQSSSSTGGAAGGSSGAFARPRQQINTKGIAVQPPSVTSPLSAGAGTALSPGERQIGSYFSTRHGGSNTSPRDEVPSSTNSSPSRSASMRRSRQLARGGSLTEDTRRDSMGSVGKAGSGGRSSSGSNPPSRIPRAAAASPLPGEPGGRSGSRLSIRSEKRSSRESNTGGKESPTDSRGGNNRGKEGSSRLSREFGVEGLKSSSRRKEHTPEGLRANRRSKEPGTDSSRLSRRSKDFSTLTSGGSQRLSKDSLDAIRANDRHSKTPSPSGFRNSRGSQRRHNRTPSPRGRPEELSLLSPASNASEPSPPREMQQSFEHIISESDLTETEDDEENRSDEEILFDEDGQHQIEENKEGERADSSTNSDRGSSATLAAASIKRRSQMSATASQSTDSRRTSRRISGELKGDSPPSLNQPLDPSRLALSNTLASLTRGGSRGRSAKGKNTDSGSRSSSPFDEVTVEDRLLHQQVDADDEEGEGNEPASSLRRTGSRSSSGAKIPVRRNGERHSYLSELANPANNNTAAMSDNASSSHSQHSRDQERVRGALASDAAPIQAFRKARRRGGKGSGGITVEGLRRNASGSEEAGSASGATGSQGAGAAGGSGNSRASSDPSLNVPQGWGRKARPLSGGAFSSGSAGDPKNWLGLIHEGRAGEEDEAEAKPELDDQGTKNSSIADWVQKAAMSPLPEVEEPISAASARVDRSKGSGESEDINVTDSIGSFNPDDSYDGGFVPAAKVARAMHSSRQSDKLLRLVREEAKAQAEEQRDGGWVDVEKPEEHQSSSISGQATDQQRQTSGTDSKQITNESATHGMPEANTSANETGGRNGFAIPHSPVVIYPGRSQATTSIEGGDESAVFKPKHARRDSRDILRALARNESKSPSPGPPEELSDGKELEADTLPKNVTPLPSGRQPYAKTPRVTGAWIDTPAATVKKGAPVAAVQSSTQPELASIPETRHPAASGVPQPAVSAESAAAQARRLEDTAPDLPKSALAAILEKAKKKRATSRSGAGGPNPSDDDTTLLLDDSTIESLEDLLVTGEEDQNSGDANESVLASKAKGPVEEGDTEDLDSFVPKTEDQKGEVEAVKVVSVGNSATAAAEARQYSSLAKRLTHLKTSLADARHGLGSLQKKLTTTSAAAKGIRGKGKSRNRSSSETLVKALFGDDMEGSDEFDEGSDVCLECEKSHNNHRRHRSLHHHSSPVEDTNALLKWRPIMLPLPTLFVAPESLPESTKSNTSSAPPKNKSFFSFLRYRPTALALLLIPLLAYAVAEAAVTRAHTPPFYAARMDGFGVDADAPRPPLVLAKMGLRAAFGPGWGRRLAWDVPGVSGVYDVLGGYRVGFGGEGDGAEGEGWSEWVGGLFSIGGLGGQSSDGEYGEWEMPFIDPRVLREENSRAMEEAHAEHSEQAKGGWLGGLFHGQKGSPREDGRVYYDAVPVDEDEEQYFSADEAV